VNEAERFVLAHTLPARAPLVPEIGLHLASAITPIWQATEDWLAERGVEPPFWAFAWPGWTSQPGAASPPSPAP
jgi:predicted nicotinamide N-methyase